MSDNIITQLVMRDRVERLNGALTIVGTVEMWKAFLERDPKQFVYGETAEEARRILQDTLQQGENDATTAAH